MFPFSSTLVTRTLFTWSARWRCFPTKNLVPPWTRQFIRRRCRQVPSSVISPSNNIKQVPSVDNCPTKRYNSLAPLELVIPSIFAPLLVYRRSDVPSTARKYPGVDQGMTRATTTIGFSHVSLTSPPTYRFACSSFSCCWWFPVLIICLSTSSPRGAAIPFGVVGIGSSSTSCSRRSSSFLLLLLVLLLLLLQSSSSYQFSSFSYYHQVRPLPDDFS